MSSKANTTLMKACLVALRCAIIAALFLPSPAGAFAQTPEDGVRQWFLAIQSRDKEQMLAAMCRKWRDVNSFVHGVVGDTTNFFGLIAAMTDHSAMRFEQVRMSSSGLIARVRVTGPVRLADGRIVDFGTLNAQQGASDVALVVFEDGAWRHCNYIPL